MRKACGGEATQTQDEFTQNDHNNATEAADKLYEESLPICKICRRPKTTCNKEKFKKGIWKDGIIIGAKCKDCTCKTKHWRQDCATHQRENQNEFIQNVHNNVSRKPEVHENPTTKEGIIEYASNKACAVDTE